MKLTHFFFVLTFSAISALACDPIDKTPEETCEMLLACGATYTQTECLQEMGSRELSTECLDAMFATTCEDHFTSQPSYMDTCYDACTVEGKACDKDDLKICYGGYEYVYDCLKTCRYLGKSEYSGTCGTVSPSGDVSAEGDVCWCYE